VSLTRFELTPRECRELCEALETASVMPWSNVSEPRAYRLWLLFDSFASPKRSRRSLSGKKRR
jgi:hypothetical protein